MTYGMIPHTGRGKMQGYVRTRAFQTSAVDRQPLWLLAKHSAMQGYQAARRRPRAPDIRQYALNVNAICTTTSQQVI